MKLKARININSLLIGKSINYLAFMQLSNSKQKQLTQGILAP